MSVQPAKLITHSIKIDSAGKRSYEEKYLILCTAGTTDDQALLAAGMPRWGDPYPGNPNATVSDLSAELAVEACGTIYTAIATYTTATSEDGSPIDREDPISDPPVFSFKTIRDRRIAEKDQNGKVYQNSAKVLFDPPFERQWNRRAITIERNELLYSSAYADEWQNVINSAAWGAYAARTAMVVSIDAVSVFDRGMSYWRVTYEVEINPDGWQPSLLDRGLHILDGAGKPVPIERDGVRLSEPVLLNGSGAEATGSPPTAVYI